MSRSNDLQELNSEIAALEGSIQSIATKYQAYALEVSNVIKERLVSVGLWDEIHGLESERVDAQQKAQTKANTLQDTLKDKIKIRDYLISRGAKSKSNPIAPVASEEDLSAAQDPEQDVAGEATPEIEPEVVEADNATSKKLELVKEVTSELPTKKAKPVAPSF